MERFQYLIVGGGIAGVSAAEATRRRDAHGAIAILGNELVGLYSRVLLPGYVKGELTREQIMLRGATDFEKNGIKYIQGSAITVSPSTFSVELADGRSIQYERLLIATGGAVRPFTLSGMDSASVYHLQTIQDAERLRKDLPAVRRALVIGGGFIALEFLGILEKRGIPTSVILRDDHLLSRFMSKEASALIHENAKSRRITFHVNDEAEYAEKQEDGWIVKTKKGVAVECDAVFVGVGIQRAMEFLQNSGILLGAGGVLANQYLETNISGIYVAGDVAEYEDLILGKRKVLGNWNNAFLQGTTAGSNMAGAKAPFKSVSSYGIVNLGIHIAVLGDVDPHMASHVVLSPIGTFEELFLESGIIRGAVLINRASRQGLVRQWIADHVAVSSIPELQL
ncbi:MAG: FAD-dependent oxidoreductase [Candidatus Sungbacteria bacterium]|nr:FAD-dependent oxidoreductase [Candidatus Sungbacteria bacterium]